MFQAEVLAAVARGPMHADKVELCRLIKATLKLNTRLDQILEKYPGWTIRGEGYDKLMQCAHNFATTYSALSRKAASMEPELFALTIKLHYIMHICMHANKLHPKVTWCFGGGSCISRKL